MGGKFSVVNGLRYYCQSLKQIVIVSRVLKNSGDSGNSNPVLFSSVMYSNISLIIFASQGGNLQRGFLKYLQHTGII